MPDPTELNLEIPEEQGGARLDVALAALVKGQSRSQVQRLINVKISYHHGDRCRSYANGLARLK